MVCILFCSTSALRSSFLWKFVCVIVLYVVDLDVNRKATSLIGPWATVGEGFVCVLLCVWSQFSHGLEWKLAADFIILFSYFLSWNIVCLQVAGNIRVHKWPRIGTPAAYVSMKADQVYPHLWRVTCKPRALIPTRKCFRCACKWQTHCLHFPKVSRSQPSNAWALCFSQSPPPSALHRIYFLSEMKDFEPSY